MEAPGVAKNSPAFNLVEPSTGTEVCEVVTVLEYGVFECLTKKDLIVGQATQLAIKQGSSTYACANNDTQSCTYEQTSTTGFPVISEAT